jgi:hypothetical protein
MADSIKKAQGLARVRARGKLEAKVGARPEVKVGVRLRKEKVLELQER